MSNTFYIKKTAFDNNNLDLTVRATDSFIIGPGELNGPAGLAQNSDLELYGFGAIKWGEGVNQNQYRLMESNACPQKETGDFLPGTDTATGFVPGTGSYNTGSPLFSALLPKDENDLGVGNGITIPLIGQPWYNTTDKVMYNYELSGWITIYQEVTDALAAHAADDSLHVTALQNTFLDGLTLAGSPPLTFNEVNTLTGISLVLGGGTVQGQLDLMVEKAGDIMSGDLTIASGATPLLLLAPTLASGTPRVQYNDSSSNDRVILKLDEASGDFIIERKSAIGVTEATLTLGQDGNISIVGGSNVPTLSEHLARMDYVDEFLDRRIGGAMSSNTDITFQGGGEVMGLPVEPSANDAAASKIYVDTKVASVHTADNEYSTVGTHTLEVPEGITVVYVTGVGAGQGGQGGGDHDNLAAASVAGRGGECYVNSSLERISFRGGYNPASRAGPRITGGSSRPWVWWTRTGLDYDLWELSSMHRGNNPSGNQGGRGGSSIEGIGGAPINSNFVRGNPGTFGAGGAGGFGQDGWGATGGSSGGFAISVPLKVTPLETITIEIGAGSTGTNAGRGLGGNGGDGYILIRW